MLEKEYHSRNTSSNHDVEEDPLLQGAKDDPDQTFRQALDHELDKIGTFYEVKELEVFGEVDDMLKDEEAFDEDHVILDEAGNESAPQLNRRKSSSGLKQRQNSLFKSWGLPARRRGTSFTSPSLERINSADSDEDNDGPPKQKKQRRPSGGPRQERLSFDNHDTNDLRALRRHTSAGLEDVDDTALSAAYDSGATLKRRMTSLYVLLCELRSFAQLNKTGFTKVLKKYDKTVDRNLKSVYVKERVSTAYVFKEKTMDHIAERIGQVEQSFANINTGGDLEQAKRELRLDLREHVVWERNTVWREMIGIERKAQAANLGIRRTMLGPDNDKQLQGDEQNAGTSKEVSTLVGKYRCPRFLLQSTFYVLVAVIAVFLVLLLIPIMEAPEQQNCLAMVIFVSLLWATEVSFTTIQRPDYHRIDQFVGHPFICHFPARPFSGSYSSSSSHRSSSTLQNGE